LILKKDITKKGVKNATTPCDERFAEAMLPYFSKEFGNPSSIYKLGKNSRDAIEKARENVAKLLDCNPEEIFFYIMWN
jgi:cysteine desulfurase